MKNSTRFYGNFPSSGNYDPNVPIGYNKWEDDRERDESLCFKDLKPQKKPDPRFKDVEKSVYRAVSAQEAQG